MLWLLGTEMVESGAKDVVTEQPPVCRPCARYAATACPYLRRGGKVAVRVRSHAVAGVRGALYQPGLTRPVLIDAATVTLDSPSISWCRAGHLMMRLREWSVVRVDG